MKYLTILLALAALSTSALAQTDRPERPERDRAGALIERIKNAIDGGELSARKQAYLEHRLAYLELHVDMRQALRDAINDLPDDASEEARMLKREEVREMFATELAEVKAARRDLAKKRRANRGDDAPTDG